MELKKITATLIALLVLSWSVAAISINAETEIINSSNLSTDGLIQTETQTGTQSNSVISVPGAEVDTTDDAETSTDTTVGTDGLQVNVGVQTNAAVNAEREFEKNKEENKERHDTFVKIQADAKSLVASFQETKLRWRMAIGLEKDNLKEEMETKARLTLLTQTNAAISYLEWLKGQNIATAKVQVYLDFWQQMKNRLEQTDIEWEELKEISAEIREQWYTQHIELKTEMGLSVNTRIAEIIVQAKTFLAKMEESLAQLKADGKSTAELETGIAVLKNDIKLFEEMQVKLFEKYRTTTTDAEKELVVKEGHALLKVMHKRLKGDFELMKALFLATAELKTKTNISSNIAATIRDHSEIKQSELKTAFAAFTNSVARIGVRK